MNQLRKENLGGIPATRGRLLGKGNNLVYSMTIHYPDRPTGVEYAVKLASDPKETTFGENECDLFVDKKIKGAVPSYGPYEFTFADGTKTLAVASPRVLGQNLDAYARGLRTLPKEECVSVMAQASRTLHSAHQQGVVHMDVKPGNMMRKSETGEVLTIDWEMASKSGEKLHQSVGTPIYMAPEVCLPRARAHAKSDVYSLGMSIAELNTGDIVRRFPPAIERMSSTDRAKEQNATMDAFIAQDTRQPTVTDPHLNLILKRATMPDPKQRGSALDVMTDLAAYKEARAHFDPQDREQIAAHLVKRASDLDTRNPVLDAAAAHGLLAELPREHRFHKHVTAISQLGPALTEVPVVAPIQQQAAASVDPQMSVSKQITRPMR